MKKLSALILALALVFSISACGQTSAPAAPSEPAAPSTPAESAAPAESTTPAAPEVNWPEREVRLIVPYAEGGGSHKTALVLKDVSEKLNLMKYPFIAVCMPNAATLEGQEEVLNAKPDGYTILIHHNAMINGYALGKQDFTYDSFRMIGQIYETPMVIAVRSNFPANDLKELTAEIHNNAGKYKWTWAGAGGNTHFASYVFYNAAGIDPSEIVPCVTKGDGDSVVQCMGGTADIIICQSNAVEEYVKSGDMKVLGNSSEETIQVGGKDVPSWKSQGFNDTYCLRCFGFLPKETPDDVAAKITEIFEQIVNSKECAEAMAAQGIVPRWLAPDEALAAFVAEAENANKIAAQMN